MPNLWKFLLKPEEDESAPKVEVYQFEEAEEMVFEPEVLPEEPEEIPLEEDPEALELLRSTDPISFAQVQSDRLIKDAELRAEQIIANLPI